jgi:hypothetical protein
MPVAEYQYVWHGNGASIFDLAVDDLFVSAVIAFILAGCAYYLIGDGWAYFKTKSERKN